MYHFVMHFRVIDLMLELPQKLNFHIGEDLHFMHNFIMTCVHCYCKVQIWNAKFHLFD